MGDIKVRDWWIFSRKTSTLGVIVFSDVVGLCFLHMSHNVPKRAFNFPRTERSRKNPEIRNTVLKTVELQKVAVVSSSTSIPIVES